MPSSRTALLTTLLAAGTTVSAGCGAPPDEGPPRFLDPCLPTLVILAPEATDEERAAVGAALDLWNAVGGPLIALQADPVSDLQVLPVGFQRAAPAFHGLYRPARGDILINSDLADRRARAITIAHEMGHAFQLSHLVGRRSLMNPGNVEVPPAEEDVRLINERRGSCSGL